jgi:hypothetical protein
MDGRIVNFAIRDERNKLRTTMAIKISKKIKGYSVGKPDDGTIPTVAPDARDVIEVPKAEVIQMHEKVERPDTLIGATYKIKSPLFEHALYVTINDIVLNAGTEHELRRPFEIFINSKNMDHFQWIVALTRIMSAVFRKGGDVTFLVEELKAVFDPRGGYFKAGGIYMPSIVAELGAIIEQHLKMIGLLHDPDLDPEQRRLIAEKRAAYEARLSGKKKSDVGAKEKSESLKPQHLSDDLAGEGFESARKNPETVASEDASAFPPSASMCNKCSTKAVILMDGCATCLNCGYSKCG